VRTLDVPALLLQDVVEIEQHGQLLLQREGHVVLCAKQEEQHELLSVSDRG
jgi:LytS/YehU family sensor histidine kinase